MDEDALDAAREAVAATRLWREQMRHDWGIYREPEEVLDAAVGELLAERDRLRAAVEVADAPNLGLATTRELLDELRSRIDVDYASGGGGLDYTTVSGRPDRLDVSADIGGADSWDAAAGEKP